MKPLKIAIIPQSEVDRIIHETYTAWLRGDRVTRELVPASDPAAARAFIIQSTNASIGEVWMNDRYQVNVRHGEITHLSIKRLDKEPCRDWRDFQAIKDQICGKDREAVELYPADERVVDTANQYHLWVMPKGFWFPFGFDTGCKADDGGGIGKVVQRRRDA